MSTATQLSDVALESEIKRLVGRARQVTVALLVHLAEFDARRLYLPAGFSSLFTYCCSVLRLSESEAYNRIEAARAARRFPRLLEMLGQGTLNLTTVRLLAPHLTEANQGRLIGAALGKTKREVEELVAREAPRPPVPPSVRKLPERREVGSAPIVAPAEPAAEVAPPPSPPSPPTRRAQVAPLSGEAYRVTFTASAATRELFGRAALRPATRSGTSCALSP
jgi:hypothetical protein